MSNLYGYSVIDKTSQMCYNLIVIINFIVLYQLYISGILAKRWSKNGAY